MLYFKRRILKIPLSVFVCLLWLFVLQTPHLTAQISDTALSDTSRYGKVTFQLSEDFDSLFVVINDDYKNYHHIKNKGTIRLNEGDYTFTVATKRVQDITFSASVVRQQQDTAYIPLKYQFNRREYQRNSSYSALRKGANIQIFTDPRSQVIVNDSTYGYGSMDLLLDSGTYRIVTRHPEAGQSVKEIDIILDPLRFQALQMFNTPDVWTVRMASIVPGGGQFFKKEPIKVALLGAGFIAGTVMGYNQNQLLKQRTLAYDRIKFEYQNSTSEAEALELGNQADRMYTMINTTQRRRNIFIGSISAIYLFSLLDAWLKDPKGGYRHEKIPGTSLQAQIGKNAGGLQLKVHF